MLTKTYTLHELVNYMHINHTYTYSIPLIPCNIRIHIIHIHIGGDSLDNLLYCSVEKNDCVHVPGKEQTGWNVDKLSDLPTKPSKTFNMVSLQGMYIFIYLYIII